MIYTLYKRGQTLQTVYNEREAKELAIEFDNEDPADIRVQNDDGSTNRYITLVCRPDKNGCDHWV